MYEISEPSPEKITSTKLLTPPHWYEVNFPNTAELTRDLSFAAQQLVVDALAVVPYHHSLEALHLRMLGRSNENLTVGQRKTNLGQLTAFLSFAYLRNQYLPTVYSRFSLLSPHETKELTRYVQATQGILRKNEFPHPDGLVLELEDDATYWAATCEYTAQLDLMRSGPKGYKLRQLERNTAAYAIQRLPLDETVRPTLRKKFAKKVRSLTHLPITRMTYDPKRHTSLLVIPRLDDEKRRDEVLHVEGTEVVPLPFTFNQVNKLSEAVLKDAFDRPMIKCRDTQRIEEEHQLPIDVVIKHLLIERAMGFGDAVSLLEVNPIFLKTWMRRLQLDSTTTRNIFQKG